MRKRGRPSASATRAIKHEPEIQAETFTSSHKSTYNKLECFFCQGSKCGKLHVCRSQNVGVKIGNIVKASSNKAWKFNYADLIYEDDALSRDILYHKDCMTDQWQKHQSLIQGSSKTISNQSTEQQHTMNFWQLKSSSTVNFERNCITGRSHQSIQLKMITGTLCENIT